MKRCPRCSVTKPFGEFTPDKTKASGYVSYCRPCNTIRQRASYRRTYDGRKQRPGWQEQERVKYMKRHGGFEEWNRLFEAQGGLCYLCLRPLPSERPNEIHVDHDHTCCPSGQHTKSCKACRRGLAHAACNQIIGLISEDMDLLRVMIAQFEPAQVAARERIAAKANQGTLDLALG